MVSTKNIAFLGAGMLIPLAMALLIPVSESAIPPTPAFMNIATNDTDVTTNPAWANATKYNDNLWILTDGSIKIEIIQYDGGAE